ncbi:unnamed protein product [Calypogeia fissa]
MAFRVGQMCVLLKLGLLLCTLQQGLVSVEAWGADGHHITCLLAEPLLTPSALAGVRSLLPEYANGSLASLCTWPDDVRWMWKWQWTSPLHYIDTPDFYCNYNYARDCHNEKGQQDMCVAGGINNYSSQLLTYHASGSALGTESSLKAKAGYNLTEALLFLAHFMGDIHQPLHVAFTGDGGGNTIILHWYTRKYNLHHIWDNEFIARARDYLYDSDLSALKDALFRNITTTWLKDTADWAQCPDGALVCPDLIADESIILACKWAYRNATPGTTLQDDYFYSRLPIVNQQLAKGGVRLAAVLNRIFSTESAPAFSNKAVL